MAALLSTEGLSFISSWSPFSATTFFLEENSLDVPYIGYCYYGGPLPYKPVTEIDLNSSISLQEAEELLYTELKSPVFSIVNFFGFTKFAQHELDALVSICTTYRSSEFFELFKQSSVFNAIQEGSSPAVVAELIATDLPLPLEVSENPKKYGIFYDIQDRRNREAALYEFSTYSPCAALNIQEKTEGGKKIFY